MAHAVSRIGVKVLTMAVGIPVGILTKKLVERTWTMLRPDEPPHTEAQARARWADAAGYAALTAAATVAARTVSQRGGEKAWRAITGLEPPPPPPSKDEKKAAKKQKHEGEAAGVAAAGAVTSGD
jgi:hypothetical protein